MERMTCCVGRIGKTILLPVAAKHVAFAPARQDEWRFKALVDLGAKVANVNVDDVGRILVIFIIQMIPDHGAGDHLTAMKGQELQKREFARRKMNRLAAAFDDTRGGVD